MDLVKILSDKYMKSELPEMNVGDTVRVLVRVKEGNRERTQAFEGTIIAKKHGGINETITVRRISYGVGCEKVFPVHSPSIVSVKRSSTTCATASARARRSRSVSDLSQKKEVRRGFLFLFASSRSIFACHSAAEWCIIYQLISQQFTTKQEGDLYG